MSPNGYTEHRRSKLNIASYHFRFLVRLGVLTVARVEPAGGGRPEHFHQLDGPLAAAITEAIDKGVSGPN